MALLKRHAAAEVMEHYALCANHGYTQGEGRWGQGKEEIALSDGSIVTIPSGDRDCSSGVISAYLAVGIGCGRASYLTKA